MRPMLPLFSLLFLLTSASCTIHLDQMAALVSAGWIQTVERSLVKLTYGPNVCTGFVVDAAKGLVLTAAHCVPEVEATIEVDGVASRVLKKDASLALVAIEPLSRPPLILRTDRIPVGAAVVSFGYGYGWLQVVQRHIASWQGGDIVMDSPITPGMSGGPVVDLMGQVVGVNQGVDGAYSLSVACGVDELRAFLKD